ncbi:MAG: hypothetical protein LBF38_06525 [Deltaproteobacteria bacterium]|nr:hypothetical protein [Deltaproteobacteria bacterium]
MDFQDFSWASKNFHGLFFIGALPKALVLSGAPDSSKCLSDKTMQELSVDLGERKKRAGPKNSLRY